MHVPVFDGLFGDRKEGFVQVAWLPPEALPAQVSEEIDLTGDGQAEFRLELDTRSQEAQVTPYAPWVGEVEWVLRIEDSLAVRTHLRNPAR